MTIISDTPFGIIKPIGFLTSMLTSSTAAASDPTAWSSLTDYTVGQVVSLASTQLCYECLVANTNDSPDANILGEDPYWKVSNTEALLWSSLTNYIVGGRARLATTNKVYECVDAHTDASPDVNLTGDTPKWVVVGATNEYAPFDSKFGTQCKALNTLTIVVTPGKAVDSLALLNLLGSSVTITCHLGAEQIYTKTVALQTGIGVYSWKTYFMAPIVAQDDVVATDLLPYNLQTITIEITGPGIVAIGGISFGTYIQMGVLGWGANVGIRNFDKKFEDDYGNIEILDVGYAKRFDGQVTIETSFFDQMAAILAQVRGKPVVYIGAGSYKSSLIVYGFFKDFSLMLAYDDYSYCSINVESLV